MTVFDYPAVERLASIGANDEMLSTFIGLTPAQFGVFLKADPDLERAVRSGRVAMRIQILSRQFEIMRNGDVKMAIWLGKQFCGQSEQSNQTIEVKGPLRALEIVEQTLQEDPDRIVEFFPGLLESH